MAISVKFLNQTRFGFDLPVPQLSAQLFAVVEHPCTAKQYVFAVVLFRSDGSIIESENVSWDYSTSVRSNYSYSGNWTRGLAKLPDVESLVEFTRIEIVPMPWKKDSPPSAKVFNDFMLQNYPVFRRIDSTSSKFTEGFIIAERIEANQ